MLPSGGKPVSPIQKSSTTRSSGLLGLFLLFVTLPVRANSLQDAAHELAMRVCTIPHKGAVSLRWEVSPDSSGFSADIDKKWFVEQISACGMRPSESPDAAVLRVTMQVTPSRVLLVADSTDNLNGQQIRIVELPRGSLAGTSQATPGPRLRSELIWQQPESIDSAMEWQEAASQRRFLFFLSEGRLVRIAFENGVGKVVDSAALPVVRKRSRLADGRIAYGRAESQLLIGLGDGRVCGFDPSVQGFSFTCGPAILVEQPLQIRAGCEYTPRYLAAGIRDYSQTDRIVLGGAVSDSAEQFAKRSESDSLDVPGPVVALSAAENAQAALAVVKNLATGNHEVYRITAVCSD